MTHCTVCGNEFTPAQKKEKAPKENLNFYHEGQILIAEMIRYNDAFYEITSGKFKGNLIHIFNIKKS